MFLLVLLFIVFFFFSVHIYVDVSCCIEFAGKRKMNFNLTFDQDESLSLVQLEAISYRSTNNNKDLSIAATSVFPTTTVLFRSGTVFFPFLVVVYSSTNSQR